MRILKWLFQPVYLLLAIVLVALYVNREAIFPETLTASPHAEVLIGKVDDLVTRLHSDVQQPSQAESLFAPEEPVAAVVAEAPPSASLSGGGAADNDTAATGPAVTTTEEPLEYPAGTAVPAPLAMPLELEMDTTTVAAAPPSVTPHEEVPPGPESLPASAVQMPPLEIWRAARTAVWQGDLNGAVAHYRQLIDAQPDNFDAYGEMGNVLLAQADVAAAVEAYATAARLIRKAGHPQMAYRLAGIVAEMDEEQGRALLGEFSPEQW